jgi:hypothetical protein
MTLFILATFYVAMVLAGYAIRIVFSFFHLVPVGRAAKVVEASITWNYTMYLNIVFLVLAFILIARFVRTNGRAMLAMMNTNEERPVILN